MATLTAIASGVGAAIGGKLDAPRNRLIFAGYYGRISTVSLQGFQFSSGGGGYSNPEDVVIVTRSGTEELYVTERAGNLLRLNPNGSLERSTASTVAQGLTAPQQIAIDDAATTAYVIEYVPAGGTGRLVKVDLATGAVADVLTDVQEGVGVIFAANDRLYITEQVAGGRLVQVNPQTKQRTVLATNLPAPFFLSWLDAGRTRLALPLRDPGNRIMEVNLANLDNGLPRVTRLLDGVPWRPSSTATLPGGSVVVFADIEVAQYDMTTGPQVAVARGMGGGGHFKDVKLAPVPPVAGVLPPMVMSSDMTGIYLSTDGGRGWKLQDSRVVTGYPRFSAEFFPHDPNDPNRLLAAHHTQGLRVGRLNPSAPTGITWTAFSPPLEVNGTPVDLHAYDTASTPTAAAFSPDAAVLLFGTTKGVYVLRNGTWSQSTGIGDVEAVLWGPDGWAFAADLERIHWSTDRGATWHVLGASGFNGLPVRVLDPQNPDRYGNRPVRALAGATDPRSGNFVLYAAIGRGADAPTTGGLYRCELPAGATPGAPPPWRLVSTPPRTLWDRLAAGQNADVVYLGTIVEDPEYDNVFRGVYDPATQSMATTPVLKGYQGSAGCNVTPGWIDEHERNSLGFGFGGAPNAIAVDRAGVGNAAYVNGAFVDVTTNLASGSPTWQQAYTRSVPTHAGPRWRTNGTEVTTVWNYYVHPRNSQVHFLANTDISLSRSDDAGDTWRLVKAASRGVQWTNFYEMAFAGDFIFAAVSKEHDLPYDKQFSKRGSPGNGAVLVSADGGLQWSELAPGTLPDRPVTSVVCGGPRNRLYAAVFGEGVYEYSAAPGDMSGSWARLADLPLKWVYQVGFDALGRLLCLVSRGAVNEAVGAGLYRWENGSWRVLSEGVAAQYPGNTIYPVTFTPHPSDPETVWLCTMKLPGNRPHGAVWATTNASAATPAWTPRLTRDMLPSPARVRENWLSVFSVAFDPADTTGSTVYAATATHGIWYATNAASQTPSWNEFAAIPFVRAQRLVFPAADPGSVYVTTHGAGAWRAMTAAHGQRWQQRIRREAYFRFQSRNGTPGTPVGDWLNAQRDVLGEAIRRRAYTLYEARGRTPGRAVEDWLEAERSVIASMNGGR